LNIYSPFRDQNFYKNAQFFFGSPKDLNQFVLGNYTPPPKQATASVYEKNKIDR